MNSIIQSDTEHCFACQANGSADYWGLDKHHVFGGANRKKSEKYGLTVYLCHDKCHLNGVHKYGGLDLMLKQIVQKRAMDHYGWSVDDFIGIFGRNYIQEETRND